MPFQAKCKQVRLDTGLVDFRQGAVSTLLQQATLVGHLGTIDLVAADFGAALGEAVAITHLLPHPAQHSRAVEASLPHQVTNFTQLRVTRALVMAQILRQLQRFRSAATPLLHALATRQCAGNQPGPTASHRDSGLSSGR
jgi:hypothetical protein